MTEPLPTEGLRVKYHSRNPVVRRLMAGFLAAFDASVRATDATRILEAGCGEGVLTERLRSLRPGATVFGLDASRAILEIAAREHPGSTFLEGSITRLPFADGRFDLVVACEVLEHVDDPERALDELRRTTSGFALLSVPREPIWRVLNVARGKYWSDWGNTPGHVQHWRPRQFLALVSRHLEIVEVRRPFPWTMVLCRRRPR